MARRLFIVFWPWKASTAWASPELCDGLDDNGDGTIDNGPVWAAIDADGDGFGDPTTAVLRPSCNDLLPGEVSDIADIDDTDARRHPYAQEHCNGVDDDGDGSIDEGACPCDVRVAGSDVYLLCEEQVHWLLALTECDAPVSYTHLTLPTICSV